MMATQYRSRAPEGETVEKVDSMDVMGAHVMVGQYPDGSRLISIADEYPINAEDADHVFTHGALPSRLLPKDE